jgi:nucleoredoxin
VNGIPSLQLFKPDGEVITSDGRSAVSEDPTGEKFPWPQKSMADILKDLTFTDKDEKEHTIKDLQDAKKKFAFYFSAHWCPPCQNFTPQLAACYNKIAKDKNWEVIFVSSDRDEASFKEYRNEMPWATLPFANREAKAQLSKHFEVEGIPCLVMLDENLETLNTETVGNVKGDPEGNNFPWKADPFAVNDIDVECGGIDEGASFVVVDNADCKDANYKILSSLAAAAREEEEKKPKKSGPKSIFDAGSEDGPIRFFQASQADGNLRDRICDMTKLDGKKSDSQAVLMMIPEGGFYSFDGTITEESAKKFLADFKAGKLTKKAF